MRPWCDMPLRAPCYLLCRPRRAVSRDSSNDYASTHTHRGARILLRPPGSLPLDWRRDDCPAHGRKLERRAREPDADPGDPGGGLRPEQAVAVRDAVAAVPGTATRRIPLAAHREPRDQARSHHRPAAPRSARRQLDSRAGRLLDAEGALTLTVYWNGRPPLPRVESPASGRRPSLA